MRFPGYLTFIFLIALTALFAMPPDNARASTPGLSIEKMFDDVMPGATHYSSKSGDPPVTRAYKDDPETGEETLIGYVFKTSEVPPRHNGYSDTIDVLVGLGLDGVITGVAVIEYSEPMKQIIGDFLRRPGVQEQFTGKSMRDRFRVGADVDGVSRATITVRAMALEIRSASRNVAKAYFIPEAVEPTPAPSSAPSSSETVGDAPQIDTVAEPSEPLESTGIGISAPIENSLEFDFAFEDIEEETTLSRLGEQATDVSVWLLIAVLVLSLYAFLKKSQRLRWVVLAVMIGFLGFIDGSFLSVSHVTSAITNNTTIFASDLKILVMLVFTVAITLLWGRVYCGYICPFGAIQTFISWLVPKRFQRELPRTINTRAQYIKYVLLLTIVLLAFSASDAVIFEYIEPFGTVFFLTPLILLWAILVGVLVGSAVIPQFYCRYACPLGATLGVLSIVSLFRIKRVAQCGVCSLCEQKCPTGAITRTEIEFRECVRCSICESQLISLKGTCRHDLEKIRARFKNWSTASKGVVSQR